MHRKTANCDDFVVLNIDISKKLKKQNFKNFIFTSLSLNNIDFKNKKVYTLFIDNIKEYQVFIFDTKYKFLIFEYISAFYYGKESNTYDLFVFKDFMSVYKNKRVLYFQKIEQNTSSEELTLFLSKKLNVKIENYYFLDDNDLKKFKQSFTEKKSFSSFNDINKRKINDFFIFCFFILFIIFSIFIYYDYIESSFEKKIKESTKLAEEKKIIVQKNNTYEYFYLKLSKLLKYIKKYHFKLLNLELKDNNIKIIISSKDKNKIYLFLNSLENIKQNSISYDESQKLYNCSIDVKIHRK